jgi:phosphonate transport system permease protein
VNPAAPETDARIAALWRSRPRTRFLRISMCLLAGLMVASWLLGGFDPGDTFSARRKANFARFLDEVRPYDLRDEPWDWGVAGDWAGRLLTGGGIDAAIATLAISVLAIVLAAIGGLLLALPAARNWATPQPFAPTGRAPSAWHRAAWRVVVGGTRFMLILLRSLPEFVLAFLIMSMIGSPAWPAVLALAIHNMGILGRLDAETIENVERRPLVALRGLGASRLHLATVGIFPAILPRVLLYFFYRWETCVREATVLGILGLASLGFLIDEAQVRFRYDEMVLYILLGVAIVLLGDLVSAVARRLVRRAS